MTVEWLPKLLQARQLGAGFSKGDALLGQIARFITTQAPPLITQLQAEIEQGWWRDPALLAGLAQIQRQHALWLKNVPGYLRLHQQQTDLPLAYPNAWDAATPAPGYQDFETLQSFFNTAALDPKSAFWTASLLTEAQLHLVDAQAAATLREVERLWQPIFGLLHEAVATQPVEAYLAWLNLLYELGDLPAFLDVYATFCQTQPAGSPAVFPWREQLRDRKSVQWMPFRVQFITLLRQLITIRRLQRRASEPDLALLAEILQELLADAGLPSPMPAIKPEPTRGLPSPGINLPTPHTFGFLLPPLEKLTPVRDMLRQIHPALTRTDGLGERRAAVVGLWLAFAERHTFELGRATTLLASLPAGAEAFEVLLRTLRGEVAYFAGRYEPAQLLFDEVIQRGQLLLQLPTPPAASKAARAFVGLAGQWRGNALFYLADYAAADQCYEDMAAYLDAAEPETLLLQELNRGNLAFLRNNLADHRGYVTYDAKEQLLLKNAADPDAFLGLKYAKHRAALAEAAKHYATALQHVPALRDPASRRSYLALIAANQANICWMQANLQQEAAYFSPTLAASLSDLGAAADLYRQALVAFQKVHSDVSAGPRPDKALAATLLANLSELHLLLNEPQLAIERALACLTLMGIDPQADPAPEQAAAQGILFPESGWRVFLTLARAYERLDQRAAAAENYSRARQIVAALRDQIRSAEWQISAAQDKFQVYECAMHFHYATGRDAAAIFNLAEQLRSQTFLDLLAAARLNLDAALAPELRQEREALAAEHASRNNAIRAEAARGDSQALETLLGAQRDLARRWQLLQSRIAQELAAETAALSPRPQSWPEFQAWLAAEQPDTVVLSFVVGSEWSYLLIGDASRLDVYELSGRAAIEYAVSRLTWFAQKGVMRWEDFWRANRHAVAVLFGAVPEAELLARLRGKRLVILPDGVLHYLPFEMLLLETPQIAGAPLDPATHRLGSAKRHFEVCSDLLPFYMLNLGTISVAQSASVWRMLQTQPGGAADVLALGVYNLNYKTDLTLSAAHQRAQELLIKYTDLAQTKSVASVLKNMERADTALLALSAWNDDQTPWPGERQSNEANFKRLLGEHAIRYILFAGHGVFNDKYPHFSGLVFNLAAPDGSAAEPAQDGFFGLNDIFNLRMPQTELTFLAACQSGLGLIARGEGVSALTRALMYHGSPSVIASLWSVDVQATMTLVEAFFAALNAQPDADKAQLLTAAKRTVAASASNPQFVHPYCWAPFVLIGKR
jgi:hypothetical protein